jgi:hypothetical protein
MVISSVMDVLNMWNNVGIDYVLVFLLVFAFSFGVLTATNILGKSKPVHVIIALVLGLMSLKSGQAVDFMGRAFPKAAVAISIILILVILTAVFVPKEHAGGWAIGLYAVGGIAFLFVVFNTFSEVSWYSSGWWSDYAGLLIGALLIIGVIIAVSATGSKDNNGGDKTKELHWEPRFN